MRAMTTLVAAIILIAVLAADNAQPGSAVWTPQVSGVTARLRGVSAVSDTIAWASGAAGTAIRTTDGGKTWQKLSVPDAEKLDFRDIEAFDERTAYVLSVGMGEASRIYKTTDGGTHWEKLFVNTNPKAFFNAIAFWDRQRGFTCSDSVDGQFIVLITRDGGEHWTPVPGGSLPAALPGEGGFAASGTNVTAWGTDHAWIGTGAGPRARVLRTTDGGRTWSVAETPLASGPSAGIFSIAFRDPQHGIVVGGDYRKEREATANLAISADGGAAWSAGTTSGLSGFRSVVAFGPARGARTAIAIGPSGADWSDDEGRHWTPIECPGFHAFSWARSGRVGWGVGENGRVARLTAR